LTDYKVALDVYNGPMDLLLFLIRREEIDISNIPIARITEQYLAYVEVLTELDPETASEFLVVAATLTEIKSRMLLPRPPAEEEDDEITDPRLELIHQLLQYKAFKDAARSLEDSADLHGQKHPRSPALPPADKGEIEIDDLEIWDLFDAFSNLLEQTGKARPVHKVEVDDTPLLLHAEDIVDSIERAGGSQCFNDIFAHRSRAEMIGLFLALLELIRQRRVRVSQDEPGSPILIHLLSSEPIEAVEDRYRDDEASQLPEQETEADYYPLASTVHPDVSHDDVLAGDTESKVSRDDIEGEDHFAVHSGDNFETDSSFPYQEEGESVIEDTGTEIHNKE